MWDKLLAGRAFPGWRKGRTARPRDGVRIAVIGNCQARGIVPALRILAPRAEVTLVPSSRLRRDFGTLDGLIDGLRGHDHVFSQDFSPGLLPGGGGRDLLAALPRARLYPTIVFSAFHPDAIYLGDAGAAAGLVPSPLNGYHSAIAAFGHLIGLPPERILALYRGEVFARLGYLDAWSGSVQDLIGSSRAVGFDLSAELTRWSRRGAFMHVINHPHLAVLGDVAARLLREAGREPARADPAAYLVDGLLDDVIWPIYPAIAAHYGLGGSTLFKDRRRGRGPARLYDLDGFVRASLALYRRLPPERLTSPRLTVWQGSAEIRALFEAG